MLVRILHNLTVTSSTPSTHLSQVHTRQSVEAVQLVLDCSPDAARGLLPGAETPVQARVRLAALQALCLYCHSIGPPTIAIAKQLLRCAPEMYEKSLPSGLRSGQAEGHVCNAATAIRHRRQELLARGEDASGLEQLHQALQERMGPQKTALSESLVPFVPAWTEPVAPQWSRKLPRVPPAARQSWQSPLHARSRKGSDLSARWPDSERQFRSSPKAALPPLQSPRGLARLPDRCGLLLLRDSGIGSEAKELYPHLACAP